MLLYSLTTLRTIEAENLSNLRTASQNTQNFLILIKISVNCLGGHHYSVNLYLLDIMNGYKHSTCNNIVMRDLKGLKFKPEAKRRTESPHHTKRQKTN